VYLPGKMNNADGTDERFLWNQESTRDLIESYKKYPVLYAPNHDNYTDKTKRLEALKAIRREMIRHGRKITVEDIRKKIRVLRTQYARQLSKIKKSQLGRSKRGNVYKPRFWCFAQLEFLSNSDAASSVDVNSRGIYLAITTLIVFSVTVKLIRTAKARTRSMAKKHKKSTKRSAW
jgi:hypothetical protein